MTSLANEGSSEQEQFSHILNYGRTRNLHHKFEWIERDRPIPKECPVEWIEPRKALKFNRFGFGTQSQKKKGN